MLSKIRTVLEVHHDTEEVTVTSKSLKRRRRKNPTGLLQPHDFCVVSGDTAMPLVSDAADAPQILTLQG